MKKYFLATCAALALMTGHAFADEAEGAITAVDATAYTMTLDNGESYKLPDEFDITLIGEGMRVALAYDEVDGAKLITDMEQID